LRRNCRAGPKFYIKERAAAAAGAREGVRSAARHEEEIDAGGG